MKFLSLEPFVPSGDQMEKSKSFFQDLGFAIKWDAGDYVGFENEGCKFILQNFNNKEFADNFMLSVQIGNAEEFWQELNDKKLAEKYGIKISPPSQQPYGKEVNI